MTDEILHEVSEWAKRVDTPQTSSVEMVKERFKAANFTSTEAHVLREFIRILEFSGEFYSTEGFAKHLGVTRGGVKYHLGNIYKKLGIENIAPDDKRIVLIQVLFIIETNLETKQKLFK